MSRPAKSVLAQRRSRVIEIIGSLPEAEALPVGGHHLSLEVRRRRFGYLLDDHHGDGRLAINCKAAPGVNSTLARTVPDRFHLPKDVGRHGWLGLWIDLATIDWVEVEAVLIEAYGLLAPQTLSATVAEKRR